MISLNWQSDQLSYNTGENKDYAVAQPNTHLIYELMEHVKGPDLTIEIYRISMAQGNNGISQYWGLLQGPVSRV